MGDRRRKRAEPGSKFRLAHRRNDVRLSGITNKRGIFADAEPFGRQQRLRGERGTFAAGLIWLDRAQTNRELIWRCPGPLRPLKRKTGRRGPPIPARRSGVARLFCARRFAARSLSQGWLARWFWRCSRPSRAESWARMRRRLLSICSSRWNAPVPGAFPDFGAISG